MNPYDGEIWGIEMNQEAAIKAENECYKVLIGDFDNVFKKLPKHYFDCVIFNDVLEHLIAHWDTIRQVKSLLSKEGVLVVPTRIFVHFQISSPKFCGSGTLDIDQKEEYRTIHISDFLLRKVSVACFTNKVMKFWRMMESERQKM